MSESVPGFEDVLMVVRDGVARITINRPERRNALRSRTVEDLTNAFTAAEGNPEVGVIVLTGSGDRAFCAGGDFSAQTEDEIPQKGVDFARLLLRLSLVMRGCPKPIVARVQGWAVAAGNELQLLCDLSVASNEARLRQGGPDVGGFPAWWGCQLLPLAMGDRRAREAVLLARTYTAAEAEEFGLINAAVPADELDATVDAWCTRLLSMSPIALRYSKSYLNASSGNLAGSLLQSFDQLPEFHAAQETVKRLSNVAQGNAPGIWSR